MRYIKVNSPEARACEGHPCIHYTGSVTGMIKYWGWKKGHTIVRCGQWIYNLSL